MFADNVKTPEVKCSNFIWDGLAKEQAKFTKNRKSDEFGQNLPGVAEEDA